MNLVDAAMTKRPITRAKWKRLSPPIGYIYADFSNENKFIDGCYRECDRPDSVLTLTYYDLIATDWEVQDYGTPYPETVTITRSQAEKAFMIPYEYCVPPHAFEKFMDLLGFDL